MNGKRRTSAGRQTTRLTVADLAIEAWGSISRDLGRSVLTAVGTLLGSLAFVATLGITGTVSHQVSDSFDIRRATTVTVGEPDDKRLQTSPGVRPVWLEDASVRRAQEIAGVVHAGPRAKVERANIARVPGGAETSQQSRMIGATASALQAMGLQNTSGRAFDNGHAERGDRVAMLSQGLAQSLSITRTNTAVTINDISFTIIGIYDDVERDAEAMAGFVIPLQALERDFPFAASQYDLLAQTSPGAASQAGTQLDEALQPNDPTGLKVVAPPDPQTLRQEIEGSVTQMSLLASVVALVVGAVSIGNAATASMVLRTSEIGLRRAMGARRVDIFAQLLGETAALGGVGGIVGAAAGIVLTVGVSLANSWTPILDIRVAILAILTGCAAGAVAGVGPALRATKISPAVALAH